MHSSVADMRNDWIQATKLVLGQHQIIRLWRARPQRSQTCSASRHVSHCALPHVHSVHCAVNGAGGWDGILALHLWVSDMAKSLSFCGSQFPQMSSGNTNSVVGVKWIHSCREMNTQPRLRAQGQGLVHRECLLCPTGTALNSAMNGLNPHKTSWNQVLFPLFYRMRKLKRREVHWLFWATLLFGIWTQRDWLHHPRA